MDENLLKFLLFSLIAFIGGLSALVSVRHRDRKNYIIQKATPLPLRLVNEHDDVWLKGTAECDAPLSSPHFGHSCIHYDYKLEEKVKRSLKEKAEWVTREKTSDAASFLLRDAEHRIHVEGDDAKFEGTERETDYVGALRHTVDYFPYPSDVNVIGSVSIGKKRLERRANIPLLVTTKNREDHVRAAERKEAKIRLFGFLAFWAGMTGILLSVFRAYTLPAEMVRLAFIAPAIIVGLYWSAFKYNTMVNYRNRIDNAWHQVDVDLSMRYDLIPRLVECAKGIMKHERELIERLIHLRSEAVTGRKKKLSLEAAVATSVSRAVARVEDYPDLKAQDSVSDITRQMRAIEEKIAHARSIYNETVQEYNTTISIFPQTLIASLFGFSERSFFSIPEEKAGVPDTEFP